MGIWFEADVGAGKAGFGMGAGVEPHLHAAVEARFGFPLLELWGMTENVRILVDNMPPRQVGSTAAADAALAKLTPFAAPDAAGVIDIAARTGMASLCLAGGVALSAFGRAGAAGKPRRQAPPPSRPCSSGYAPGRKQPSA